MTRLPLGPWKSSAACLDVAVKDLFFAHPSDLDSIAAAKQICRRCPVRVECLDHAMATGERQGIWGATTPAERRARRTA